MQGKVILRDEFNKTLKLMKTGKAAGIDNIAMELIQNASKELQDELFKLVNDIYTTGEIPKDFKESIIVPIPKKATADKCNEFRTISLMTHAAKILVKIICFRIESIVEKELSDDQFGFRRNKGTREAILSLRILIEKQIEVNKNTFIAFIDLEKAFDKVPWKELFYTLEGIGADYRDRRIIYNLYKDQSATIKVTDKTETAIIRKGVRQGCPLSPTLFNIYVEQPIKEIRETLLRNKIGIKVGGEIISFLRFADDIALLANNEHDLKRALEEMARCFHKYHLIINWQKTKVMLCQKSDRIRRINIQIGNQLLEQVEQFKYLGSLINQDGRCVMEIRSRIAQAKAAFTKKKNLLCSNSMSIRVRKRFIKVYVWSVALYGCETWIINKAEQRSLESFEMWCWRRMLKVSWIEHRTNESILKEIDEGREILKSIRVRRWNMMGHILRRENELIKRIIEGKMEGKRGRGRPRTSFVKQMISDARLPSYAEVKRLAEKREEWRAHIQLQNQP